MTMNEGPDPLNPFPWYAQMRAHAPLLFYEPYQSWQAFRYDDVLRILSDYAAFSSNFSGGQGQDPLSGSMIAMDPPRHRQLRTLVTQAFTPRAVARLSDRITEIVNELLDRVIDRGEMDFVEELSYPLPVIVIAEMLGIPQADRARFKVWSDAIVGAGFDGPANPQGEMSAYFLNMIARRQADPGEDLISGLLAAQIDGEHLTTMELLGFCVLLLVAGNETTTNLLGNAVLTFDEHPEVWDALRADPELVPSALEEVLRYRSPVQMMYRRAIAEVTIADQTIRPGQMVLAQIGSANRDAAQFPEPDRFDITRAPNRHLAFGHGIHFCLGAPLARLEGKIAVTLLLERLRDIRQVPGPLEHTGSAIVYGVKHLPITFKAA